MFFFFFFFQAEDGIRDKLVTGVQTCALPISDVSKIKPEDRETAIKIAAKLKEMRNAKGVENLEQCAVAVREQGTRAEDVVPSVKVVGNAWISLMAYQNRGYAYIAP